MYILPVDNSGTFTVQVACNLKGKCSEIKLLNLRVILMCKIYFWRKVGSAVWLYKEKPQSSLLLFSVLREDVYKLDENNHYKKINLLLHTTLSFIRVFLQFRVLPFSIWLPNSVRRFLLHNIIYLWRNICFQDVKANKVNSFKLLYVGQHESLY